MNETEYLILGGGPAGIGAALRLQDKGADWHLLEAEDHFGGLAASFVDEKGFTWDLGGHVQFSHYETFDRYMDMALGKDGWLYHERESWVWIRKRFVPYPFQSNLHRLDPAERDRCVDGLRQAASGKREGSPGNFRDWILATFGEGIAEIFLLPYNRKVWAYPAEMLDYRWFGDRVAVPDLEEVMRSVRTGEDQVSWGPNRTFRFPRFGGTGSVWEALGGRLPRDRVRLNSRVERIDASARVAHTADGQKWKYRAMISTAPLDALIRMTRGAVDTAVADRLLYSATHVVGIGMEGQPPERLRTKCWMYFPESNSPYYRITVFTNYSPNNAPRPGDQWSLMTEVSESSKKPVDRAGLLDDTLRALREDRLIPEGTEVCSAVVRTIPQAYPTPFLGRDGVIDPILRRFEDRGLFSRGRFGAWKYEVSNQDHCFAQGYECAERLMRGGGPGLEPTLFTPHEVNARRNP
ncbi:MAG: FAD-dependent oxidoreductase [Kiritimatiellae bacterium]|nr:FAD-dependent oxidoreductase [Kiritimatiellia bacterium]